MPNFIWYNHIDSEVQTVTAFLDQFGLSIVKGMNRKKFFQFKGDDNVSNLDRIWANYSKYEKQSYQSNYRLGDLDLLKVGTVLALPKESLFIETVAITGANQVYDYNYNSFYALELSKLLGNPLYKRVDSYILNQLVSSTIQIHPYISVMFWCKSIQKLIDVTPFISAINTNVDSNGGNFQINLPGIGSKYTQEGWDLSDLLLSINGEVVHRSNVIDPTTQQSNKQFFSNILHTNDLVFIRFEQLELEKDRNSKYELKISNDKIPGTSVNPKVYDMIGLIDSVSTSLNYEQSSVNVNVSGRDLSKVLIEDGSYFYPLQFAQQVFINPDEDQKLIRRLAIDGQFILQNQYTYRSIRYTLQYLMNHVASMGLVPDEVFNAYGNRRSLVYRLEQGYSTYIQSAAATVEMLKYDIQQYCSAFSDTNTLFNQCINFIESAYSNKAIIRDSGNAIGYSPFNWNGEFVQSDSTPSAILNLGASFWRVISVQDLNGNSIDQTEKTTLLEKLFEYIDTKYRSNTFNNNIVEVPANGIWQIIKLVVDSNVADRRIVDASISQPDGSLINQFNKICQAPFVEFFTDTYGDLFHFIVRQPPYTKESIVSFLQGSVETESGQFQTTVLNIEGSSVISEQFSFSEKDVYSFYEIKPQGLFLGAGSEVSLAYIPIVYFPQYSDIWGARRMSVVSNYIPYSGISGQNTEGKNYIVEQCAKDLKYLIDIYCYMPFVRSGSVTIIGDRRIKRGTWIRYKLTGEVFYVSQVSHNFMTSNNQINYTTTLALERGMVEKYVYGSKGVSYFDIVDTELIRQYVVAYLTQDNVSSQRLGVQIKRNFGVNQDVFDFFMQKKQFE